MRMCVQKPVMLEMVSVCMLKPLSSFGSTILHIVIDIACLYSIFAYIYIHIHYTNI